MVDILAMKSLWAEENESYDEKEDRGYLHDGEWLLAGSIELWIVMRL